MVKMNNTKLSLLLKIFGILSTLICLYAGIQPFFFHQFVEIHATTLDFYRAVGTFFIGSSFFFGPLLWGIADLINKK